ncbi:MAG TPA: magnesium transporter [Nevskiaceae bacterium]|nr:magnesium transporter [Nevskiaceae bacterium]
MSETAPSPESLQELLRAVLTRVPRDGAELLAREGETAREWVRSRLPAALASEIDQHLPEALRAGALTPAAAPPPGSVAELMEPAHGVLDADTPVAEAIRFLREHATPQLITYLYVTSGPEQRLVGLVVMRDLLLAQPTQTLRSLMLREPFGFAAGDSTSHAIRAAVHRHYPVYPVTDGQGRIVGVVRGWRLFERQAIEISAQSGQMVGVDKEERVTTSLWRAFRMRHPWLQLNLLTAFLAAFVVGLFEDTIAQIVTLAAFLPVLAGQSGNNGCQTLAITLRGLTLGDLAKVSVRRLVLKEMTLGALNGLLTGVVAGLAMWWTASGGPASEASPVLLGIVIALAMTGACMFSGLFGVMTPLLLKRFGADPATASSIFLTTGTDIAGMGLMLGLASVLVL